jgi:glycosyltransferase involved in cell wall biosynthesis
MAALDQPAAQRAADKAGGPGYQNLRQPRSSAAEPARLRKRSCGKWIKEGAVPKQGQPARVALSSSPPKLLFLVTEDWYFCSHRLPIARAARGAGFEVVVATRVRAHGEVIRAEGFALRPLAWRRRGDNLLGAARAIRAIARLYRAERPDIVHHVALKPVLFGGIARRLACPRPADRPAAVDAVMGLGSGFSTTAPAARLRRWGLGTALRLVAGSGGSWVVAQNPEDRTALAGLGIDAGRIALIRGSGVDSSRFVPLPEPETSPLTVALVARMLRDKGVLETVAAIRRLRAQGLAIELVLAGPTDPDSANSLSAETLRALAAEPGVEWLGSVADVRTVWRRAAIAVLPSTYGEGVPKTLLEAAACARPVVATDVPGCREAVRHGETGILVPPHDIDALAAAIAELAADPVLRARMGRAGRAVIEQQFADAIVARETLALYRAALAGRSRFPATRENSG